MTDITCLVYVDQQDASNIGWAWRVVTVDEHGARHEESGAADDEVDGIMQCHAVVACPTTLAAWDYVDGDGEGHYRWTA